MISSPFSDLIFSLSSIESILRCYPRSNSQEFFGTSILPQNEVFGTQLEFAFVINQHKIELAHV